MSKRPDGSPLPQQRARIASAAAQLIAEEGIANFAFAKHKAASRLGLPESAELPERAEAVRELLAAPAGNAGED
jgi:hypothetical protein